MRRLRQIQRCSNFGRPCQDREKGKESEGKSYRKISVKSEIRNKKQIPNSKTIRAFLFGFLDL